MTPQRRTISTSSRRGSAYVFVLGVTMIVTVLGMGALKLSRVTGKVISDSNDWETAGTLAFSATEQAMSVIGAAAAQSPTGWRSAYTSGQTAFTQIVGTGQFSWTIKDQTDGNLSADYLRSFRVYGVGKSGNVTRVYSVQVTPAGTALDVLRTAVHTSNTLTLTGSSQCANGPFSSNGNVSLSGTVNGAIEAASTTGSAAGTQTITTPSPAKAMPASTVMDNYVAQATTIDYNAIPGKKLSNCLLSPTSNPYGTANASGIYYINVPSGKTLTVTNCRIVGTLLIGGVGGNTISLTGPNLFEPGPNPAPTLIISSPGADVTIAGSNNWLSESVANVNFNPTDTPFQNQSNSTQTDDFPPQYRGVLHVIAGNTGSLVMNNNAYIYGTLITDCPVQTKTQSTFVQNAIYQTNPPVGYMTGDTLALVPGTWKWDAPP